MNNCIECNNTSYCIYLIVKEDKANAVIGHLEKDKYDALSYITIILSHAWLGRLISIYGYIDVSLKIKQNIAAFIHYKHHYNLISSLLRVN